MTARGWTTEHSASSYARPVLVYGGTLCDTIDEYARALVSDWLTAGGLNAPADVQRALDSDRDALARVAYSVHVEWRAAALERDDDALPPRLSLGDLRRAVDELAADRRWLDMDDGAVSGE